MQDAYSEIQTRNKQWRSGQAHSWGATAREKRRCSNYGMGSFNAICRDLDGEKKAKEKLLNKEA